MKKTTQIVVILAAVAVGYAVWHFKENLPIIGEGNVASASKPSSRPPLGVVVADVVLQTLPRTIRAVGTAKANESVDITSKVTAKIKSLNFKEGQSVKTDSLLVQLDDAELQANLTESEAERDNSQKLYDRSLKLYTTKNVPKAQVDLLLSQLQASEAKILADKARIDDHKIRAPFAGKLGLREVSVGSLIRPGDLITTLDDTEIIKVDFDLAELFLADVGPDQDFEAKSVAYPDRVFEGKVQTIATRVDPVTRAVRVRGIVPNEDGLLKPGMFLSIELRVSVDTDVLMIAEEAVVTTIGGHHVYAVRDGKAIRTPIKIGRRTRGFAEVIQGLTKQDQVIVEGLQRVKDGMPVKASMAKSDVAAGHTQ